MVYMYGYRGGLALEERSYEVAVKNKDQTKGKERGRLYTGLYTAQMQMR